MTPKIECSDQYAAIAEAVTRRAQPVLDTFFAAVAACGHEPPFKPRIEVAKTAGPMRYDPTAGAVILVPYEALDPGGRAAMERFSAVGTLGLSGRDQHAEVFNSLMVAHELGHWLQEIARRPLNRWQAEYEANQIMVAFWRAHPAETHTATTEMRLANFVAQSPGMPDPTPKESDLSAEDYFNAHLSQIESNPAAYAGFQKMMVRQAMAELPAPSFCQLVVRSWPG